MQIAVTGATGFIGRYIVRQLAAAGHQLRCWYRPTSDRSGLDDVAGQLEWVEGDLGDPEACVRLVAGCEAVVHGALWHPGGTFIGGEGAHLLEFVEKNILGSLQLMEAARSERRKFIFISTCAVYDRILPDRPLDETHPLWPLSHYGAHKAAIEKFVHSYGFGHGDWICALRPTGVYGLAHPPSDSKWYGLVRAVVRGEPVTCERGGKEVHARDVAAAVQVLLDAPVREIIGEAFNCYDRYVSQWDVAHLAREICGSSSEIHGRQTAPQNQIITEKLRSLGATFGGDPLLRATISELVDAARAEA